MDHKGLVVKVRRDINGCVTHVMLDDGSVYPMEEALSMSKKGLIENIIVKQGENGPQYFRDHPTTLGIDDFDHLPEF